MASLQDKRKKIEELVYKVFDALDKSGTNTTYYKEIFESMSDEQFKRFMDKFVKDPNEYIILHISEYEHTPRLEDCGRASEVLGIPLMETVYMPHISMDKKNIVATKEKCLVGYINVKRTQQMVSKKTGMSTSSSKRNVLTNQLTQKDKNGRDSDTETMILITQGADNILKELHGPRSDDNQMKNKMLEDISTNGFTQMTEIESRPQDKQSLNLVDAFFLGMQIKTNLVTSGKLLMKTYIDNT